MNEEHNRNVIQLDPDMADIFILVLQDYYAGRMSDDRLNATIKVLEKV